MPVLSSKVDVRSADYVANARHMQALAQDLAAAVAAAARGGGDRAREKHLSRGKLLPRDRIEALLE